MKVVHFIGHSDRKIWICAAVKPICNQPHTANNFHFSHFVWTKCPFCAVTYWIHLHYQRAEGKKRDLHELYAEYDNVIIIISVHWEINAVNLKPYKSFVYDLHTNPLPLFTVCLLFVAILFSLGRFVSLFRFLFAVFISILLQFYCQHFIFIVDSFSRVSLLLKGPLTKTKNAQELTFISFLSSIVISKRVCIPWKWVSLKLPFLCMCACVYAVAIVKMQKIY